MTTINILVTGHQNDRLMNLEEGERNPEQEKLLKEELESNLRSLIKGLEQFAAAPKQKSDATAKEEGWNLRSLIKALEQFAAAPKQKSDATAKEEGWKIRLIAGDADGVDEMSRKIANELGIELICAGVHTPKATSDHKLASTQKNIGLFEEEDEIPPESNGDSSKTKHNKNIGNSDDKYENADHDSQIKYVDEFKLFYADLVIIVWDGQPPRGREGGSVRLLIESLRRRKPVIWMNPKRPTLDQIQWLDVRQVDQSIINLLDVDERHVVNIKQYFSNTLPNDLTQHLCQAVKNSVIQKENLDLNKKPKHDQTKNEGRSLLEKSLFPDEAKTFLNVLMEAKISEAKKLYPISGFQKSSDINKPTWELYHTLDCAAIAATEKHTSQIWRIYLLGAAAVLFAILGMIFEKTCESIETASNVATIFSIIELLILSGIFAEIKCNRKKRNAGNTSHHLRLKFRHGAETIRSIAIVKEFLGSIPKLEQSQWESLRNDQGNFQLRLVAPQIWLAIRALRDEGFSMLEDSTAYTLSEKIPTLKHKLLALINEQQSYHKNTRAKLHKKHHKLEKIMKVLFYITLPAVVVHLAAAIFHWEPIHANSKLFLIVTAGFPALIAAFHAISVKLEMARLATQSSVMEQRLEGIRKAVRQVRIVRSLNTRTTKQSHRESANKNLKTLHELAIMTANTLYADQESWFTTLRNQGIDDYV